MAEPYRLEALLQLRRQEEDVAQGALAQAERIVAETQAEVAKAQAERTQRSLALEDARGRLLSGDGRRASVALTHSVFVERCRAQLAAAESALAAARSAEAAAGDARERARRELDDRRRARETVEKHKAKWAEAQRREASRREEIVLDELALRRGGGPRS